MRSTELHIFPIYYLLQFCLVFKGVEVFLLFTVKVNATIQGMDGLEKYSGFSFCFDWVTLCFLHLNWTERIDGLLLVLWSPEGRCMLHSPSDKLHSPWIQKSLYFVFHAIILDQDAEWLEKGNTFLQSEGNFSLVHWVQNFQSKSRKGKSDVENKCYFGS